MEVVRRARRLHRPGPLQRPAGRCRTSTWPCTWSDRHGVHALDEAWSDTGAPADPRAPAPGATRSVLTMAPMLAPGEYQLGVWIGSAVADGRDARAPRRAERCTFAPAAATRRTPSARRVVQPEVTWEMRPAELDRPSPTG